MFGAFVFGLTPNPLSMKIERGSRGKIDLVALNPVSKS